jgi:hypothetical protein
MLQTDRGAEYLLVTPGNSLYFPAVDFIKQSVGNAAIKQGSSQVPVVVDCRYILGADFTAAKVTSLRFANALKSNIAIRVSTYRFLPNSGYKNVD